MSTENYGWDSAMFEDLAQDMDKTVLDRSLRDSAFPDLLPTPPTSNSNSPAGEGIAEDQRLVSVSTTFYPGASTDALPTDLILLSADAVFFNVHSHRLLAASENAFAGHLPVSPRQNTANSDFDGGGTQPVLTLAEPAQTLNLILHSIYGLACTHYAPPIAALLAATAALPVYGLPTTSHLAPSSPLFDALLAHAPQNALQVYTLAAEHDASSLAALASSHLLSLPLASLTDADASAMGPVYLKRLFFLHLGRADALKRLLLAPPPPHPPSHGCGPDERGKLTRAWALAAAYLAWDSRPDVLPSMIEAACRPLQDHLGCDLCRAALQERTRSLVQQWAMVKGTI